MYALIRMDFIALRFYLTVGFGLYLLYAIPAYDNALAIYMLNIAATIFLALASIMIHDKYRIESLLCFLPPSRHQVVLARYFVALLALLAGLSLQYVGTAVASLWLPAGGFRTLCAPQAVLVFCLVPLAFIALYYPCYFRFGMGRGFFAFLILAICLTMVLTSPMLVAAVRGDRQFAITPEVAQQPERILVALVDHLAAPLGTWPLVAVTATGGLMLVAISLLVSIRLFQRRDF